MRESLFDLDLNKLDRHVVEQVRMVEENGSKLADARRDYAAAKSNYELTESEIYLLVRKDPERAKLDGKPTEAAIKAKVATHKKVREAELAMLEAKHAQDVYESKANALEHRKRMIEAAVTLFVQSYWSKPDVRGKGAAREVVEEMKRERVFGKRRKDGG